MPTAFLSLPPEIRNQIYKYLLVCTEPIDPWAWFLDKDKKNIPKTGIPDDLSGNILFTNTTISREARYFLYAHNHFALHWFFAWDEAGTWHKEFLSVIGKENAALIEHVHFDILNFTEFDWKDDSSSSCPIQRAELLESIRERCTNLKTLTASARTIDIFRGTMRIIGSPSTPAVWKAVYQDLAVELQPFSSATKIYVETEPEMESEQNGLPQRYGWILRTRRSEAFTIWLKLQEDDDINYYVGKHVLHLAGNGWPAYAALNHALDSHGLLHQPGNIDDSEA